MGREASISRLCGCCCSWGTVARGVEARGGAQRVGGLRMCLRTRDVRCVGQWKMGRFAPKSEWGHLRDGSDLMIVESRPWMNMSESYCIYPLGVEIAFCGQTGSDALSIGNENEREGNDGGLNGAVIESGSEGEHEYESGSGSEHEFGFLESGNGNDDDSGSLESGSEIDHDLGLENGNGSENVTSGSRCSCSLHDDLICAFCYPGSQCNHHRLHQSRSRLRGQCTWYDEIGQNGKSERSVSSRCSLQTPSQCLVHHQCVIACSVLTSSFGASYGRKPWGR